MPTLYLLIGLPGSGKTTLAKKLETELPAMRFTPDELFRPFFGQHKTWDEMNEYRDQMEQLCWKFAARALALGIDAIIDFGLWGQNEREDYRARGVALGASVKFIYLPATLEEMLDRCARRNEAMEAGEFFTTEEQVRESWEIFHTPTEEEMSMWDWDGSNGGD